MHLVHNKGPLSAAFANDAMCTIAVGASVLLAKEGSKFMQWQRMLQALMGHASAGAHYVQIASL